MPRTRQFCSEGHERGPINYSALGLLLFAPNLTTNWCSMEARTSSETQIRLTPSHTASGDRITPQSGPLSYTTPNPALPLGLVFPTPRLVLSMALPCVLSVRTDIKEEKEEEKCQSLTSELQLLKNYIFGFGILHRPLPFSQSGTWPIYIFN